MALTVPYIRDLADELFGLSTLAFETVFRIRRRFRHIFA
jgi:hypothetical protein